MPAWRSTAARGDTRSEFAKATDGRRPRIYSGGDCGGALTPCCPLCARSLCRRSRRGAAAPSDWPSAAACSPSSRPSVPSGGRWGPSCGARQRTDICVGNHRSATTPGWRSKMPRSRPNRVERGSHGGGWRVVGHGLERAVCVRHRVRLRPGEILFDAGGREPHGGAEFRAARVIGCGPIVEDALGGAREHWGEPG